MSPLGTLTDKEAAVYDRQLRVWGVETQKRLSNARVLLIGCSGLGVEVAKNLVLAGVGNVTLVDDTPCSQRDPGNFLIAADAAPAQPVSEACAATLREMNPLISVDVRTGPITWSDPGLDSTNVALILDGSLASIPEAGAACRAAGVSFFAGGTVATVGWAFADLGRHEYVVERKETGKDGVTTTRAEPHTTVYCPWGRAMEADLSGRNMRRVHPLYLVLRALDLQKGKGRGILDAASAIAALDAQLGKPSGLDVGVVESIATSSQGMPAVSAIVGGILANDVLKAISFKGEPVDNFFLFSIADGGGVVDRFGGA